MKKSIALLSSLLLLSGCGLSKEEVIKRIDHDQQYQVKSVEIPYQDFSNPSLDKDELYATVNDKSTGTNKLIRMNIKTKKITSIFKSKFSDPMIQGSMVNKDWLIWVDAVADGERNKTYVMNKKTKKITKISAAVPGQYTADAPFLYKDYVAFVYVKEKRESVVRIYDLKHNTYKDVAKINNLQLYNNFVHMAEGKLVWTDSISDKGYYYVYDLKTGQINSYESPFKYPGYAKLTNNKIFAIHFDDFRFWTNQHFGYYDINEKEFVDVDTHSLYINSFDVHGNSLAIIDDKEFGMYQLSNKGIRRMEVKIKTQPNLISFSSSGKVLVSYYSDLKPVVKIVE